MNTYITFTRIAAFVTAIVLLSAASAVAAVEPVPGIDIIVKKKPGNIILQGKTDTKGQAIFKASAADTATLTITQRSLEAAIRAMQAKGIIDSSAPIDLTTVTVTIQIGTGTPREYTAKQAIEGITAIVPAGGGPIIATTLINTSKSNIRHNTR